MNRTHLAIIACAAVPATHLQADTFGTGTDAVTIDFVTIGDPGNPNDPATGGLYGGVTSTYAIGTYEVTLLQYTTFLNAVAVTDTYSLYNSSMAASLNVAGISRSGNSGSYSYSVIGDGQRPVTYVSWFDAARFTNWLHNGQPAGLQTPGTTENGAYALLGATNGVSFSKSLGAHYWIPSESEWYKAAYYQPIAAGGDGDGYWLYPMQTNAVPYSDQAPGATPDNTRVGNFYKDDGMANGYDDGNAVSGSTTYSNSQQYLTAVGAYVASEGYYGTFDQGGNVFEWNDAVIVSSRGIRGGAWASSEGALRASYRDDFANPAFEYDFIGFRVASIPEPTSALLLAVSGFTLLLRSRRLSKG